MDNNSLISVIMGIYNCADTLEEAVNSIINQTYKNWELIMCDDGSTDNTFDVAMRLSQNDNRIKVIKNDSNKSLAPTLNHCLEYANGEFIARMDGDDICSPDRFEEELSFLKEHPEFAFVSCDMNLFDTDGIFRTINYKLYPKREGFLISSQFCHAGVIIRADAIRTVGGYSESLKFMRVEDYDLWINLYSRGFIGANISKPLYSMRDDRNAFKRRNFSARLNESRVKYKAFKLFDLPFYYSFRIMEPILKFFVPAFVYKAFHKNI